MLRFRIRLREDDVHAGVAAVAHPAFRAVDDVAVAVAHGARLNACGVGAGGGFREAKRAEDFASREAREIFFLLLVGAVLQNRRRGDGIRHAERDGRRGAHARDLFEHHDVARHVHPRAAPLLGNEHAAAAHLAKPAQLRLGEFFLAFVRAQHGTHLRLHELADAVAQENLFRVERKIHEEGGSEMLTQPDGYTKTAQKSYFRLSQAGSPPSASMQLNWSRTNVQPATSFCVFTFAHHSLRPAEITFAAQWSPMQPVPSVSWTKLQSYSFFHCPFSQMSAAPSPRYM